MAQEEIQARLQASKEEREKYLESRRTGGRTGLYLVGAAGEVSAFPSALSCLFWCILGADLAFLARSWAGKALRLCLSAGVTQEPLC